MMKRILCTCMFVILLIPKGLNAQFGGFILEVQVPKPPEGSKYRYLLGVVGAQNGVRQRLLRIGNAVPGMTQYVYRIPYEDDATCKDSLVEIHCEIIKENALGKPMVYFSDTLNTLNVISDTVVVVIPEMPEKSVLVNYFQGANKIERKKNLAKEMHDLKNFLTYWDGSLLYASYYQGHRSYFELMYGPAKVFWKMPHAPLLHSGPALGFECNTRWQKDNFILGPKLGWQISTSIMNAGLHFVYYTDFDRGSLFLKPRIGINPLYSFINISYAYSIRLTPDYFGERINRHQLCVNFMIPLKK